MLSAVQVCDVEDGVLESVVVCVFAGDWGWGLACLRDGMGTGCEKSEEERGEMHDGVTGEDC